VSAVDWHQLALNPQAISQLYNRAPALRAVELFEVALHRDGPRAMLRVDLAQGPDHPPSRWMRDGFNRTQIQLDFLDVEMVRIRGWSTENRVDIDLEPHTGEKVRMTAQGQGCDIEIIARFFRIDHVRGYLSESGQ
jgi:hypothetical protein